MRTMQRIMKCAIVVTLMSIGFVVYGVSAASPTAHAACPSIAGYQTFGFDMARTSYNPYECIVTPTSAPTVNWVNTYPGQKLASREGISSYRNELFIGKKNELLALKAFSGGLLWNFGASGIIEGAATAYAGKVYFGTDSGDFYSLTLGGSLVCIKTLGTAILTTPVAYEDLIIVTTKNGEVFALDSATCSVVWNTGSLGTAITSPTVYASDVYVSVEVTPGKYTVFDIDAFSGTILGTTPVIGATFTAPVVVRNTIYVGADNPAASVFAFNAASPYNVIWAQSTGGEPVYGKPAVDGSQVYIVSAWSGRLFALDALTGAVNWNAAGLCGPLRKDAAPTVANGGVYVQAEHCVAGYTTAGTNVWGLPISAAADAPITVVNGWLYTTSYDGGGNDHIFAYKA